MVQGVGTRSGISRHGVPSHSIGSTTQIPSLAVSRVGTQNNGRFLDLTLVTAYSKLVQSGDKRTGDMKDNRAPLLRRFDDLKVDRVNLEFAYDDTGEMSDVALLPPYLCQDVHGPASNDEAFSKLRILARGRGAGLKTRVDVQQIAEVGTKSMTQTMACWSLALKRVMCSNSGA